MIKSLHVFTFGAFIAIERGCSGKEMASPYPPNCELQGTPTVEDVIVAPHEPKKEGPFPGDMTVRRLTLILLLTDNKP